MALNGWWRIAIVLMALIMGFTLWSAATGTVVVATADIPYNPPMPNGITDPIEAALTAAANPAGYPAYGRYEKERNRSLREMAAQLSRDRGCISRTVHFDDYAGKLGVSCRTASNVFQMVMTALAACGCIFILWWTVGWITSGFRGAR